MPYSDPQSISQHLLSPGPGYLIGAFQADDREARLEAIADDFRLRDALEWSAPPGEEARQWLLTDTFAARWIRLLDRAIAKVPNSTARAELTAVVRAMEVAGSESGNRAEFWEDAADRLPGRPVSVGTLRNRRWPAIRLKLADAIARLTTGPSERTLPFEPQVPALFGEADFLEILERLDADLDGLAVLIDEPGVGKSSLANAYGHWARSSHIGRSRYDQVVWLRGDDPVVLEHDFLAAARVLDPTRRYEDSADVQSVLRRTDGWLLIVDDVRMPAHLLRFLPTRATGHLICTSDVQIDDAGNSAPASREQRRRAAGEPWQQYFGASLFDYDRPRLIHQADPDAIRALLPQEVADDTDVHAVAEHAGLSRLALAMAAVWTDLVGATDSLVEWRDRLSATETSLRADSRLAHLATRPGVVAAASLLSWAEGAGRARFDGGGDLPGDDSPYELLYRLEPFASHPIPIDAFSGAAGDVRVERLTELGMGLRYSYLGTDCFSLADDVRAALRLVRHRGGEPDALAVAGLTVLHLSDVAAQQPSAMIPPAVVPHMVSLADRLAEPHEVQMSVPTSALVLRARAAIAYWRVGSPRRAGDQLALFESALADTAVQKIIMGDIRGQSERGWPDELPGHAGALLRELDLEPPSDRLVQLVPLLRQCGDRVGAYRVFRSLDELFEAVSGERGNTQLSSAHRSLQVEGALALHENGHIDRSTQLLIDLLDMEGSAPVVSRVETMLARDAQDRGDLLTGAAWLDSAWQRLTGPNRPEDFEASEGNRASWADVARVYTGVARGARFTGWNHTSSAAALLASACWERTSERPTPAHAFALSNAGVTLALDAQPGALHLAEASVDEITSCSGSRHHETALVCLNHALVRSTLGGTPSISEEADSSFRTVITHWPRRHPFTLRARLQTAACAASAGLITKALRHLLVFLDNAGLEHRPNPTDGSLTGGDPVLARAAGWWEMGSLLLSAVPHVVVDPEIDLELVVVGEPRSQELLAVAIEAFSIAIRLLARAVDCGPESADSPNAMASARLTADLGGLHLNAVLGQMEARLRLGEADPRDALETLRACQLFATEDRRIAAQTLSDATDLWPSFHTLLPQSDRPRLGITELRAIAKFVRAMAASGVLGSTDGIDQAWFTEAFWQKLVAGDRQEGVHVILSARDQVDFTLAWQAIVLAGVGRITENGRPPAEAADALRDHLEAYLVDKRARHGDGPNHNLSIWYSALAQLPDDKGTNHRRARNLREVIRNRARLSAVDLDGVRRRAEIEVSGLDQEQRLRTGGRTGSQR